MPSSTFRFKQFEICQEHCAMKVGTDGVLLGAWADVMGVKNALDVGTGTGLIALMLAQRGVMNVAAVEIDYSAFVQASENVEKSIYSKNVEVIHSDYLNFSNSTASKYDLIVSNPPYFRNSFLSDQENRNKARHTLNLEYSDIFMGACKLLNEHGRIALIFPFDHKDFIYSQALEFGFFPKHQMFVRPNAEKAFKRCLVDFSRENGNGSISEMYIEEEIRHCYSSEYKDMTREFYLNIDNL